MPFDQRVKFGSVLQIQNRLLKKKLIKESFSNDSQAHPCVVLKRDNDNLITVVVTTSSPGTVYEDFLKLKSGGYVNRTIFQVTSQEYDDNHLGNPNVRDDGKANEIKELLQFN